MPPDPLPASAQGPAALNLGQLDAGQPAHAPTQQPAPGRGGFEVHLDNFTGPFDLLLSLITKHKLDITEVALAEVTDEFIAHITGRSDWDLSEASEFMVIAATLLDLKAARLLPSGEADDLEDLELLEARDLLFARLLQYRAFKEVSATLAATLASQRRYIARQVDLEPQFAGLLPELVWSLGPAELAAIAARALAPKAAPAGLTLEHLHAPLVSVREQVHLMAQRLQRTRTLTFRALVADAGETVVVVARFLGLLEMFREALVSFEQLTPLGELTVSWVADAGAQVGEVEEYTGDGPGADSLPAPGEQESDDDER